MFNPVKVSIRLDGILSQIYQKDDGDTVLKVTYEGSEKGTWFLLKDELNKLQNSQLWRFGDDYQNELCYVRNCSPQELLELLSSSKIQVRVVIVHHNGDENAVRMMRRKLAPWCNDLTVVEPSPEIQEKLRADLACEAMKENSQKNASLEYKIIASVVGLLAVIAFLLIVFHKQ